MTIASWISSRKWPLLASVGSSVYVIGLASVHKPGTVSTFASVEVLGIVGILARCCVCSMDFVPIVATK